MTYYVACNNCASSVPDTGDDTDEALEEWLELAHGVSLSPSLFRATSILSIDEGAWDEPVLEPEPEPSPPQRRAKHFCSEDCLEAWLQRRKEQQ